MAQVSINSNHYPFSIVFTVKSGFFDTNKAKIEESKEGILNYYVSIYRIHS